MRLIAKAALGALAMASLGFGVSAPANAARVVIRTPVLIHRVVVNPCLRAPAFRPAYCFRRDRLAFLGPSWFRRHMMRQHLRRQAMLYRYGY
jgi:hypothetical protein